MWLQNLLLLGTVVCSICAPTDLLSPVTQSWKHVDATINEALSLLNHTSDPAAVMVSEGERMWAALGSLPAGPVLAPPDSWIT